MAKINISFNNKKFQIDESSLSTASGALRTHLSTIMNGSGATINFGGSAYGIDGAKLSTATNEFVTHLGTVAGSGSKVMVGGVEFSVDSTKVAGAFGELEAAFGGLNNPIEPELGFPITWNSMDVVGNAAAPTNNITFVKVSDYLPTADEIANTRFVAYSPELSISLASTSTTVHVFDNVVEVIYDGDDMSFDIYFVFVEGECADVDITFPEIGIYSADYGAMGANVDFTIELIAS